MFGAQGLSQALRQGGRLKRECQSLVRWWGRQRRLPGLLTTALQDYPGGYQLPLFERLEPTLGVEEQEPGRQNLRRGLKAEAMQYGFPTQVVWPRTVRFSEDRLRPGASRAQDPATRAWNLTTALYHKAGGSPWRLAEVESDVCFVGVSFYRETLQDNPMLRTSLAQAFTAARDGYVCYDALSALGTPAVLRANICPYVALFLFLCYLPTQG